MSQSIERDVRFLKRYAVATTALLGVLSVAAFTHSAQHAKFDVIDVGRINIVEPNGNYRMVISNRPQSIGPIYKGKPFGYKGGTRPGIIFFNDEGTENGGLTFTGSACVNGQSATTGRACAPGSFNASTHMSFDQFNSDQVVNLDYSDNNGRRLMGFSVNDRVDADIYDFVGQRDSILKIVDTTARNAAMARLVGPRNGIPFVAQRLFVGRDPDKSAVLNLADRQGKPRLRLVVDSLGAARVEFLDETGKVTNTIDGRGSR
jgi:hypothetical protein